MRKKFNSKVKLKCFNKHLGDRRWMICSFVVTSDTKRRLTKSTFLVSRTFSRLTEQLCATPSWTFYIQSPSGSFGWFVQCICCICCWEASRQFFRSRTNHISVWSVREGLPSAVFHLADIALTIIRPRQRADCNHDISDTLNNSYTKLYYCIFNSKRKTTVDILIKPIF